MNQRNIKKLIESMQGKKKKKKTSKSDICRAPAKR